MAWGILFNILSIAVMAGVLVYAWRLDRRLSALDKNRQQMEKFVGDFSGAIARAEKAIRTLQETAQDTGVDIDQHFSRAGSLRDELTFLIDAADKIATRLTNSSSQAQSDALTRRPATLMPATSAVEEEKKEPVKTVKPVEMPAPSKEPAQKNLPTWLKSLRKEPAPKVEVALEEKTAVKENKTPKEPVRSQAEKELQQALEKMR